MSDLDRMFSALRSDTDDALLPPPGDLRRAGDRRGRRRVVAGLVAVAVAVAGMTVGAREILAGQREPAPLPAITPSPSRTPPATPWVTPSPDPSAPTSPMETYPTGSPLRRPGCEELMIFPYQGPAHAGAALSKSIMLRASDWGRCYAQTADRPGYPIRDRAKGHGVTLDFCQAEAYPAEAKRTAGRFRTFLGGTELGGYESVTRYRDGGAAEFMAQLRARVGDCATYEPEGMPGPWYTKVVESGYVGDDSVLIYSGSGANGKGYPGWYLGVARVGDLVVIIEPHSDLGGERSHAKAMTVKAVNRLA